MASTAGFIFRHTVFAWCSIYKSLGDSLLQAYWRAWTAI